MGIKRRQAGIFALQEFVTVRKAGFSALRGERVKSAMKASVAARSKTTLVFLCEYIQFIYIEKYRKNKAKINNRH